MKMIVMVFNTVGIYGYSFCCTSHSSCYVASVVPAMPVFMQLWIAPAIQLVVVMRLP